MDYIKNTVRSVISEESRKCFLDFFVHQLLANHPILNTLLTALQNITGFSKYYQLYLIVSSLYMYLLFAPFALFFCNLVYLVVGVCYASLKLFNANEHERKKGSFFLLIFFSSLCTDRMFAEKWWFRLYLFSKFWTLYFVLISLTQNRNILNAFLEFVPLFGGNRPAALPFRDLKDEQLPAKTSLERVRAEKPKSSELPPAGIVKEMQEKFTESSQQPALNQEELDRMLKNKQAKESNEKADKSKEGKKYMPYYATKIQATEKFRLLNAIEKEVNLDEESDLVEKPKSKDGAQKNGAQKNGAEKNGAQKDDQKNGSPSDKQTERQGDTAADKKANKLASVDLDKTGDKPADKKVDAPGDKQITKEPAAKAVDEPTKKEEEKLLKTESKGEKKANPTGIADSKSIGTTSESKDKPDPTKEKAEDPIQIKKMNEVKNAKQDDLVFIVNEIPKADLMYPKAGSKDRFAEKIKAGKTASEEIKEKSDKKPVDAEAKKPPNPATKDQPAPNDKKLKEEKQTQEKEDLTTSSHSSGFLKEHLSNEMSPLESEDEEDQTEKAHNKPASKGELNQLQEDFDKVQEVKRRLENEEVKKEEKLKKETVAKLKKEQNDAPKLDLAAKIGKSAAANDSPPNGR